MIGAGAAGLAAAADLGEGGARVLVLEGRTRAGGRILTARPPGWPLPVESGAEFVHGASKEILEIAHAGGLLVDRLPASHFEWRGGRWRPIPDVWRRFDAATRRMRSDGADRSVEESLRSRRGLAPSERRFLLGMVEGFEAAPADRISEQSLSTAGSPPETADDRAQFRLVSGYDGVIRWLAGEAERRRCEIRHSTRVRSVEWRRGRVVLRSDSGERFGARRVIVTVPVGVLQAPAGAPRSDRLRSAAGDAPTRPLPPRDGSRRADLAPLPRGLLAGPLSGGRSAGVLPCARGGFSDVVDGGPGGEAAMLTGWVGGPSAYRWIGASREAIAAAAVETLASLFRIRRDRLARLLIEAHGHDWSADPLTRGAYGYALVGGASAPGLLARPVERTLYFAGEGTATEEGGTVQSAIRSGRRAAKAALA